MNIDFSIHRPQLYTALMACKKLLSKKNFNKKKIEDELYEINSYLKIDIEGIYKNINNYYPSIGKILNKLSDKYSKFFGCNFTRNKNIII